MRKRIVTAIMIIGAGMCLAAGCGSKGKEGNQSGTSGSDTESAEENVFDYNVNDYVTLGEYKGLSVRYPVPAVTDDDVEMSIQDLIDENTTYNEISDRTADKGDYVNIDFTGTIDGEEFEGGSAEDYEFTLGQDEFLEEFETNLLGKKTGETITFKMTFPTDYDEELAGKEAEFTTTLNSISEVVVPEYTDAFVAEVTDYDTIEAYEEALREELMASAQEESSSAAGEDALTQAVENASVNGYPQALYDACYESTMDEYASFAEMFGMELDDFLSDFMGDEDIDSVTLSWVNEILVSQAIAEKEGFTLTDKEFEEEAKELAIENDYASYEEFLEESGKVSVTATLLRNRAINYLYKNANVEEVSQEEYYGEDSDLLDTEEEIDNTEAIILE